MYFLVHLVAPNIRPWIKEMSKEKIIRYGVDQYKNKTVVVFFPSQARNADFSVPRKRQIDGADGRYTGRITHFFGTVPIQSVQLCFAMLIFYFLIFKSDSQVNAWNFLKRYENRIDDALGPTTYPNLMSLKYEMHAHNDERLSSLESKERLKSTVASLNGLLSEYVQDLSSEELEDLQFDLAKDGEADSDIMWIRGNEFKPIKIEPSDEESSIVQTVFNNTRDAPSFPFIDVSPESVLNDSPTLAMRRNHLLTIHPSR